MEGSLARFIHWFDGIWFKGNNEVHLIEKVSVHTTMLEIINLLNINLSFNIINGLILFIRLNLIGLNLMYFAD